MGHPVHPALTDFPVALWTVSILWDIVGIVHGDPIWGKMAFWCIAVGLLAAVPTAVTGLLDYTAIPQGHRALTTALWHMIAVLVAACAFAASLFLRGLPGQTAHAPVAITLGLSLFGLIWLGVGGWLGGHLVFHFGIGQNDAPPKANEGE
jgi:uncharacterized membrane protein